MRDEGPRMSIHRPAAAVFLVVVFSFSAAAQRGGRGGAPAAPAAPTEEGIPVLNADVQEACGSCHTLDDKKMMTRISYRRASPEDWEISVRRMIELKGVVLMTDQA